VRAQVPAVARELVRVLDLFLNLKDISGVESDDSLGMTYGELDLEDALAQLLNTRSRRLKEVITWEANQPEQAAAHSAFCWGMGQRVTASADK